MPTVSLWWVWRIVSFRLLDSPRVALSLRASSTWVTHWLFSYHFLEIAIFATVLELLQKTTWEHLCIIFTMPWNQFLTPHKLGMIAHACNPRIQEVVGREDEVILRYIVSWRLVWAMWDPAHTFLRYLIPFLFFKSQLECSLLFILYLNILFISIVAYFYLCFVWFLKFNLIISIRTEVTLFYILLMF